MVPPHTRSSCSLKGLEDHASNSSSPQISEIVRKVENYLLTAIYDRMPGEVEGFKERALFRLNVSIGTN
jgi:hypothetical protein